MNVNLALEGGEGIRFRVISDRVAGTYRDFTVVELR